MLKREIGEGDQEKKNLEEKFGREVG